MAINIAEVLIAELKEYIECTLGKEECLDNEDTEDTACYSQYSTDYENRKHCRNCKELIDLLNVKRGNKK